MSDANSDAPVPKPRITVRGVGIVAACWLLYALLYATAIAATEATSFGNVIAGQLMSAILLALLSVPPWLLVVREMDRLGWMWKVGAHLALAPLYAFLGLELILDLTRSMAGPEVVAQINQRYLWIFLTYVILYLLQFALYHAVRAVQRLRLKEQQAAELAALAHERELAALKAQVNPHFLFNTLNSVNAAVRRDPEAARAMLEQLAGLLRYALDRSEDGPLASLEDELTFARRYLTLESRRFGDRLDARFDIDDESLNVRVPPMTLQPLVENAVRHGIAPLEEGGTVTVRAARHDGRVRIAVEDTGAGLDASSSTNDSTLPVGGTGLENTNARLQRYFGPEASLHVEANAPRGFRVWFSVPAADES